MFLTGPLQAGGGQLPIQSTTTVLREGSDTGDLGDLRFPAINDRRQGVDARVRSMND